MDAALEDVAFLANSENRLAVLGTLGDTPRRREEIVERVDASRVTITRILRELETRNWVESTGQRYALTPPGAWVHDEFTCTVDEVAAERRLREPLEWFPSELLTFDVRCLRDAEVILLDGRDPTALVRRILEFHRSGDRIRGLARAVAPVFVENQWELTVEGDSSLELVVTPDVIDIIRDDRPTARRFREMLEQDTVGFHVHDGVPMSVGIVDDRVGINLTDEQGVLMGGLVSDHETIHEWAVDLFETCRREGRPLESSAIPV